MDCPKCGSNLKVTKYKSVEVDKCESCEGMWLDYPELDELEDTVLDVDEQKGSMITRPGESELKCPQCSGPMQQFRYRYDEIWLDVCVEEHGFWLDAGEAGEVRDIIDERVRGLKRAATAEESWAKFLDGIGGKSGGGAFGAIRGFFGGRRR